MVQRSNGSYSITTEANGDRGSVVDKTRNKLAVLRDSCNIPLYFENKSELTELYYQRWRLPVNFYHIASNL